jgi:hypothetical protein
MPEVARRVARHSIKVAFAAIFFAGCGSPEPVATDPVERVATLLEVRGPWRAVPYQLSPAALAAADRACRESLAPTMPAGAQVVVADARGEAVVQLWYEAPNGGFASCNDVQIREDGTFGPGSGGGTGFMGMPWPVLQPTEIVVTDRTASGRPITRSYVAGRFGPAIVGVQILRPGLVPVEASVANGWFGAWVEGEFAGGTAFRGFDAIGQQLIDVPLAP